MNTSKSPLYSWNNYLYSIGIIHVMAKSRIFGYYVMVPI